MHMHRCWDEPDITGYTLTKQNNVMHTGSAYPQYIQIAIAAKLKDMNKRTM